nr:MAG TPA: hypothetical protein [Caudoviricetes sp.]
MCLISFYFPPVRPCPGLCGFILDFSAIKRYTYFVTCDGCFTGGLNSNPLLATN